MMKDESIFCCIINLHLSLKNKSFTDIKNIRPFPFQFYANVIFNYIKIQKKKKKLYTVTLAKTELLGTEKNPLYTCFRLSK